MSRRAKGWRGGLRAALVALGIATGVWLAGFILKLLAGL